MFEHKFQEATTDRYMSIAIFTHDELMDVGDELSLQDQLRYAILSNHGVSSEVDCGFSSRTGIGGLPAPFTETSIFFSAPVELGRFDTGTLVSMVLEGDCETVVYMGADGTGAATLVVNAI